MKDKKIAIIAGTPVDTQMGVDFFKEKGLLAQGFPISASPEEQSLLQILSHSELNEVVRQKLRTIKENKFNCVCIYCNSLSAAVNMEKLSDEESIHIVTPLQIYKEIASDYNLLGVLAANNQSAAGIERVIQAENNNCIVVGIGILPLVQEIESMKAPNEVVLKLGLEKMMAFLTELNVEAIVVGCTHFPYVIPQLEAISPIKFIDPAEIMVQKIIQKS